MQTLNAEALFEQALQAGYNRDYRTAVKLFSDLVGRSENIEALLYLGRSYHALKSFSKAVLVLEYYLQLKPSSFPGHFFLGRSYLALGHYNNAVFHLKKSLRLKPDSSKIYSLLGIAFLQLKRPELAVKTFEKALILESDSRRILNGLLNALLVNGIRLFYQKRYPESTSSFSRVLEYDNQSFLSHLYLSKIYRETGDDERSLTHIDAAISQCTNDPVLYLQKATILLSNGKHKQALEELTHAASLLQTNLDTKISSSPNDVLRLIAITLFKNKDYRRAIYYGKKILHAKQNQTDVHVLLAECFRNLGNLQKAKNHFLCAIEEDRQRIELHYGLVMVLWEMDSFDFLIGELKTIFALNPGDELAQYYTALCWPRLDKSPKETIPLLQQQIRERGPDPFLMCTLGQEYVKAEMSELAEKWFLKSLKLIKDHRESLLGLIKIYSLWGKKAEQKTYMRLFLRHYPDERNVRLQLVRILLYFQEFEAAIKELQHLLINEPGNLKLKLTLAKCHIKVAKYSSALVLLREIMRKKPDSVNILKALIFCLDKTDAREIAIGILKQALRRFGDDVSLLHNLGMLYLKDNNLEKAAETFRTSIAISPRNWKAYRSLSLVYEKMGNRFFARKFHTLSKKYRLGSTMKSGDPKFAQNVH